MAREMTLKQRKFVELYEGNATDAAIKAGYAKKHAGKIGFQLLEITRIAEAIKKRQDKKINRKIADRNERAELYTDIMRHSNDENVRIKACEVLGKMEGDFVTRVDIKSEHIILIRPSQDENTK